VHTLSSHTHAHTLTRSHTLSYLGAHNVSEGAEPHGERRHVQAEANQRQGLGEAVAVAVGVHDGTTGRDNGGNSGD